MQLRDRESQGVVGTEGERCVWRHTHTVTNAHSNVFRLSVFWVFCRTQHNHSGCDTLLEVAYSLCRVLQLEFMGKSLAWKITTKEIVTTGAQKSQPLSVFHTEYSILFVHYLTWKLFLVQVSCLLGLFHYFYYSVCYSLCVFQFVFAW